MNILHFGKFYPPFQGGMETYLRDLAEQQAKEHNTTVIAHNHQFQGLRSATQIQMINGVKVIRQKTLKPILFTPIMLDVNKLVKKTIIAEKFDLIHISWPNPSALFLLYNPIAKKLPWVIQWQSDMVTKHSSWMLKLAYQIFKPFEKKLLKQASAIIASTKEYAKASNALKAYQNKITYIPLAIKGRKISITQDESNWANELWNQSHYKIYSIGRLTFYKNHQLLIEAAKLLPEAQFIITGKKDAKIALELNNQKNLPANVIFTGALPQEKIDALMSTCDAFCLPSNDRAESFGMVLLEALHQNKMILVSNLKGSGMKWIASQSKLGHTFDCNNPQALVDLIINVVGTNKTQVLEQLNDCFTIKTCAKSIDSLYHKLLPKPQR